MSLTVTPSTTHPTSHTLQGPSAPSAPGLFDTLRSRNADDINGLPYDAATGLAANSTPRSSHPLESHLRAAPAHATSLRNMMLRRQYGIAAPVIRSMELLDCAKMKAFRPAALDGVYGTSVGRGVHEDVLRGEDWGCAWEDVYSGESLQDTEEVWGAIERGRGITGW